MIVTQCNNLIESGGGTGPMKPDNLHLQGANSRDFIDR